MSSLPHVWKKCVLTCAALAVLTAGCATTAAADDGPTTITVDIGEDCLEYRYSKSSHCSGSVPLDNCQAAASVGDCGIQLPFNLTSAYCQPAESEGEAGELQNWHVFCQGTVPNPSTVTFDIGEHCLEARYSEASHCSGDVPMNDCWAAQANGSCGIKLPFTLSSATCQKVDTHEAQKYHVFCKGTVPSGPLPQPQCPDGHVLGYPGQECVSSCTKHCDAYCIGGYCTGNYSTCYSQYQQQCDCGVATCPCTGPNCG